MKNILKNNIYYTIYKQVVSCLKDDLGEFWWCTDY
jgi:hypothetical protein